MLTHSGSVGKVLAINSRLQHSCQKPGIHSEVCLGSQAWGGRGRRILLRGRSI